MPKSLKKKKVPKKKKYTAQRTAEIRAKQKTYLTAAQKRKIAKIRNRKRN
jgi:hypothetical protein